MELFTSQGCSSCPPADALLRKLASDPRVVPLAFHVDYWDYIGWRDPYASARWSARQRHYAAAAGVDRIYTPQLLFNGGDHFVGARAGAAKNALRSATPSGFALRIDAALQQDAYAVEITTDVVSGAKPGDAEVVLATYESGISTAVKRGENRGRTLRNDFVVRDLQVLCPVARGDTTRCEVVVPALEGDNPQGFVAFVQDTATMQIVGARRIEVRGNT